MCIPILLWVDAWEKYEYGSEHSYQCHALPIAFFDWTLGQLKINAILIKHYTMN